MRANQNIARTMGVLFLIGTVSGVFSRVITAPILGSEDTLASIAVNESQITLAALLVMTMGLALAMIPVVAYPVLKIYDEILAMGYVVFRGALEGALYLGIVVSWLLLLPLSRAYQAGSAQAASARAIAAILLETPALGAALMAVFGFGGIMLYALLFRAKLVPLWLSGWGFIAILLNITAGILAMFGVLSPVSKVSTVLQLPIFLQEIVLALWLMGKGFNPSASLRIDLDAKP